MARTFTGINGGGQADAQGGNIVATHSADTGTIQVSGKEFIANAELVREGHDLILTTPEGSVVIEGYFLAEPAPDIISPEGARLTPELVQSFVHSPAQYAQLGTLNDATPVGSVQEVSGDVTVTRTDGTVEAVQIGTPIFQGDVVETDTEGAVNIVFIDETSFSVSENARLAIDEYVFDPVSQSGESNFSVLRGVFVFTSGLIGRDDPDDVEIATPVGSIGIRGTTIAGNVNTGEITVVEGAIVLRTHSGHEITLANQFETARFEAGGEIVSMGQMTASDVASKFSSVGRVSPTFFNSIGRGPQDRGNGQDADQQGGEDAASSTDAAADEAAQEESATEEAVPEEAAPEEASTEEAPAEAEATSTETSAETTTETTEAVSAETTTATTTTAPTATTTTTTTTTVTTAPTTTSTSGLTTTSGTAGTSLTGTDTTSSTSTASGTTTTTTSTADTTTTDSGTAPATSSTSTSPTDTTTTTTTTTNPPPSVINTDTTTTTPHPFDLGASTLAPGVIRLSTTGTSGSGLAVASLGDIDNDGLVDYGYMAVSTGQIVLQRFEAGSKLPQLNIAPDTIGHVDFTSLGDINGDGGDDFITGMPGGSTWIDANGNSIQDAGELEQTGQIRINVGGTHVTLVDDATRAISPSGEYGFSVAALGDANMDGYNDFAFSAPNHTTGKGAVYVLWGTGTYGNIDLSDIVTEGVLLQGTPTGGRFGHSISTAGDFDDDGMNDIAIGAPGENKVYIKGGGDFSATLLTISGPDADSNAATISNNFGSEVLGGVDFNGDGTGDLVVAAGNSAYVVYGGQGGAINVTTMTAAQGFKVFAYDATDGGAWKISNGNFAGDFNGDGYDDVAIVTTIAEGTGFANDIYVVYGGRNPDSDGDGMVNVMSLDTTGHAFDMIWDGNFSGEDLSVSSAGDVNGDGFDDLLIGNPATNQVILFHGRDELGTVKRGTNVLADHDGQAIVGGSGNDMLDDNGAVELSIRGGSGEDIFKLGSAIADTHRFIDGGAGMNDTIQIVGTADPGDGSLDFRQIAELSGIERIDMVNGGADTLILDERAIFDMAGDAYRMVGSLQNMYVLKIDGEAGDNVDLRFAEVTPSASAAEPGYNAFVHSSGNYAILVDADVAVSTA